MGVIVYTAQADNPYGLAKNGGFEDGFYGYGPNDSQIPNGWEPFIIQDPKIPPQYKDSAAFGGFTERLDGGHCLIIWTNWVPFDAGIFQKVPNVSPGTSYIFKVEWAPMQSYNPDKGGKQKGDFLGRVVGIDPAGGTDPQSPNVVWSPELWKEKRASGDTLKVSVAAKSSTITIFIRAKNPQPHGQDQVFFDVASLNVDASQPVQAAPTDTPLPVTNTPVKAAATRMRPTATPTDGPPTATATAAPSDTPVPTDTPVLPTSTVTPIPPTPTPTRTPKPTPTPASWLDNPPSTLTGALLVVGVGSEGIALSLAGILGWLWYRAKRQKRPSAVQAPVEYSDEPDYRYESDHNDEEDYLDGDGGHEDEDFSSWD
jgi:hypothetical protein